MSSDVDIHSAAAAPVSSGLKQPYHLVEPSPWPLLGAAAGLFTVLGIVWWAHYGQRVLFIIGVVLILLTMVLWWRDVLRESRIVGLHSPVARLSLRYGMTLFIASEVMFFVGFFWAFFNYALFPSNVAGATT
ncbi:MAG: cytochrome c oxidase subunit 3, partial [Acetobacteraceae bacterium]